MNLDRDTWWWRRGRLWLTAAVVLVAAGMATGPLQAGPWARVRASQPELHWHDLKEAVGRGMVLGLLGGFRGILADMVWIRRYMYWEKADSVNTEAMIELSVALDPRALVFWDNGSANIGLDIPAFLKEDMEHRTQAPVPPAVAEKIDREQADRALKFLDRGLGFHPDATRLYDDKAEIYQRLDLLYHDPTAVAQAAVQYGLAAEVPGSPRFNARNHANLLDRLGRYPEEYAYLRKLYPTLDAASPRDAKGEIWDRLRELEDELKLPADQRLPASEAPVVPPEAAAGAGSAAGTASGAGVANPGPAKK